MIYITKLEGLHQTERHVGNDAGTETPLNYLQHSIS